VSWFSFFGALEQGFAYGLMALGVYLTFRVLDFPDLTVDGSFPLGAAVSAALIHAGVNPYLTLPVALAAGFLAGLVTAFLSVQLRILNLLASIITMTALYSINLRVMGGPNLSTALCPPQNDPCPTIYGAWDWLGLPPHILQVIFAAVLCLAIAAALIWLLSTEWGLGLRAAGDNPDLVKAQGVNTKTMVLWGVGLSNALVALSGAVVAQSLGSADVKMGVGTIIAGLASVIMGGSLFGSAKVVKAVAGVVLGSVLYRLLIFAALNVPVGGRTLQASDLNLITAALVVLALTLPAVRRHVRIRVMG
jgi:putative ABC transport system permease protein